MGHKKIAVFLLLILLGAGPALADKSYRMDRVVITADLHDDGSMAVSEQRTYSFKGKYRFAFRTFPLGKSPLHTDFSVSEDGQPYRPSDSEEPGTYQLIERSDELELRWFYRARNETRTFTIGYTVYDAVDRYLDTAVLYYKFVGEDFGKPTGRLEITVNPPGPVDQWQVRQWAHGPLWGRSDTSASGVVTATCDKLPRRRFFELRILYPADLFAGLTQHDGYALEGILAEEEAWTTAANARRERSIQAAATRAARMRTGSWAMPLLLAVGVFWFILIARRYGRRPVVPSLPDKSPEVPSNLPPAIVQYLVAQRSVTGTAIMGTLLDLARRGFLEFGEEQELGKDWRGRDKWTPRRFWRLKRDYFDSHRQELAPFETALVRFVFDELGADSVAGGRVDVEAFKKQQSKVRKFFAGWSKQVQRAGEEYGFYDQDSFRGRNQGVMVGGGLVAAAAASAPMFLQWALVPGLGGVILMLSALAIVHHNHEGRLQAKRWLSLRGYLRSRDLGHSDGESVLDSIESYLVYGVVLGLMKQHLTNLGNLIPAENHGAFIPWYSLTGGTQHFSGDAFGASFASSVTAVTTAMSSSSGAGGGASGAGGGGGGGGGGGAG